MLMLGPFRPDMADTSPGMLANLINATLKPDPQGVAYGPVNGPSEAFSAGTPLPADCKGMLTCVTEAGAYIVFAMTASNIYKVGTDGSFTSIGSGYNLPSGDRWGGCQLGSKAVFTNTVDGMLEYDIEAGGAVSAISGAPAARICGVVFDTLFALDCDGENKLMRNANLNSTSFTGGTSGYQVMPDGEELVGIAEISSGTAVVFQRNAIRILTRIADISLYRMDLLGANEGAVNPWCIVPLNGAVYYVDNGFHRVTAGGVEYIGRGKVDQWWLDDLHTDGLDNVLGAYDAPRNVVRWIYPKSSDPDTHACSGGIDYDITTGEFVPLVFTAGQLGYPSDIATSASPGYTMEELDTFGNMDALNGDMSLDDRFYFGGVPQLAAVLSLAIGADGYFAYFNGDTLAFEAETTTLSDNTSSRVNWCRPVSDATTNVSVGRSDRLQDALTWNTAATPQTSGRVALNSPTRGKNHRFKVTMAAGDTWTYIRGLEDIDPKTGGPK